MRKIATLATGLALAFVSVGCGSDADSGEAQTELADLLISDVEFGADPDCLRDKTGELSDDDAQFLVENFDADGTEDFSTEQQAWVLSLFDCFEGAALEE